jgi:lon-related putative ATP-dependent protease
MENTDLHERKEVSIEDLRKRIAPGTFDFNTTSDIEPLEGTVGQQRAMDAINRGLEMEACGFNIFACGPVGTGRNTTAKTLIRQKAAERPTPNDWVYVYNFDKADMPLALELPTGKGRELAQDMEGLIEECQEEIPKAFEEEEYEKQKSDVLQQLQERRQDLISELREKARELDHAIQVSPAGIAAAPLVDGEPISQEEFEELPEEKQEELREKNEKVQELIAETVSQARSIEKEMKEKVGDLNQKVALFAVGHLVEELKEKYSDNEPVVEYLDKVKHDIIENLDLFRSDDEQQPDIMGMRAAMKKQAFNKYRVNVVVDHSETEGAPVVDERNPTYYNLFGQLEYRSQFGGMTTDFTMIKAGSFVKASGGYLILQVLDVLRNPFAWEGLKRAIRTEEVKIENMWEQYRPIPAATLEPEPIPVKTKIVLVGSPFIYQLLYVLDEDFRRLFKIKADFDVEMDKTDESLERYAAFIGKQCEEAELPPFDREAVAKLAEHGARLTGHQERLSTRFQRVADIIMEAGQIAKTDGNGSVSAEDLNQAIEARRYRNRMIQDKIQRAIDEGILLIDTEDAVPGQVNGLAVLDIGDYRFGKPSRITCVTSIGQSGVVNIERESKMSGNIHSKGVMIMSGYLASRFGQDKPLSLTASLTFEQSYGEVEGDSASCAELYALLSSMADLPLRQDIAVTGSINQRGQVQPIGGVNEKIEGFFEVCQQSGLTGEQGVMIPASNVQGLMLNDEIVEAAREGKFHIYAVDSVKEGIEILTGVTAGEPD